MHWLVVLPIIAGEADAIGTAEIFAEVHRSAELRPDLTTMSLDEFYSSDAGDLVRRAARCASDFTCIAASTRSVRVGTSTASLALVLVLNLEVSPPILAVDLIEVQSGKVLAEHVGAVSDRSALLSAIGEGCDRVFYQAGFSRGGRIAIETDPPGASVSIDGVPTSLPAPVVRAGKHRLLATAPGRKSAAREVEVTAGATIEALLVLEEETTPIVESPWLWIGVGAAVLIAGGIAAGVVLASDPCDCITTGGACMGSCPE